MAEVEGASGSATTPGSGGQMGVRSFFIVDLSRLRQETDTLEGAKVVYFPENEFKKSHYSHRCSQLVGLALCTRDFTGKIPQFLRLKGCCYATQQLDQNYIMCLAGRPEEPGECVVQLLNHLLEVFHFYYHSSEDVMKTSKNDWEVFTTCMKLIFQKINDFVFSDQHSVPAMFRPLPYFKVDRANKNQSRIFLLASRLLRSCQLHQPIIGGCILHNREIVCNQLPPVLLEKVQLVGGDGLELNTKSILEENVAPESVWVLEVYLTPSEVEKLEEVQRDLKTHKDTYQELKPNPSLINSAHSWRFPTSAQPRLPPRRRTHVFPKHLPTRRSVTPMQDHDPVDEDYYNLPPITITDHPVDSASGVERSVSIHSEAALMTDFGVKYSGTVLKKKRKARESLSPQSVVRGGKSEERGGERGGGRGRKVSGDGNRAMPQLHSPSHALRDPDYDDPDEFLKDSPKASPDTTRPVNSTHTSTDTSSVAPPISTSSSAPICTPSTSTSLSGTDKPSEMSSPRLSTTGSSAEEERFATPSPTFPSRPSFPLFTESSAIPVNSTPLLETSSGADRSNSFQTADESSDPSLRLSSSDHRKEVPGGMRRRDRLPNGGVGVVDRMGGRDAHAGEEDHSPPPPLPPRLEGGGVGKNWSVYDSPPPPRPPKKASPISSANHPVPSPGMPFVGRHDSDSEDFVDSDLLDQMIQEAEMEKEFELQKGRERVSGSGGGGGRVGEMEREGEQQMDRKNRPLPELPVEDRVPAKLTNAVPLPSNGPQLGTVQTNQPTPSLAASQSLLAGDSGEFTVDSPPAIPPRGCSAEIDVPPPPPPKEKLVELGNDDVTAKRAEGEDQLSREVSQLEGEGGHSTVPPFGSSEGTTPSGEEGKMDEEGEKDGGGGVPVEGSQERERRRSTDGTGVDPDGSVEEGGREGREGKEVAERREEEQDGEKEEEEEEEEKEEEEEEEKEEEEEEEEEKEEEEEEEEERKRDEEEEEREEVEGEKGEEEEQEDRKTSSSSSLLASGETLTSDEAAEDKKDAETSTLKYEDQTALALGSENEGDVDEGEAEDVAEAGEFYDQPLDSVYGHVNMSIDMPYTPEVTLNLSAVAKAQALQHSTSISESTQQDLMLESVDMRSRATTLAGDLLPHNPTLRGRSGSTWLQTLGRQLQAPESCPAPKFERRCLYVQRHANTVVVLLAESGLHTKHDLLTTLWQSLLTQLIMLEGGLAARERPQPARSRVSSIAIYQGADRHCTAHPASAVYHFRHALRRTHLEYAKNPELLQVTLCKEHCRMMSQSVLERETYCNHTRSQGDAFNMTSSLVKSAKQQNYLQTSQGNFPTLFL